MSYGARAGHENAKTRMVGHPSSLVEDIWVVFGDLEHIFNIISDTQYPS